MIWPLLPSLALSFSTTTLLGFPQHCGSRVAPTYLKSMHHPNLNTSVLPQPMHACTIALASCTVTVYMSTWYRVAENLEKELATHSSVLAWRIPGTGEPGGPPSVGSHGVRHD